MYENDENMIDDNQNYRSPVNVNVILGSGNTHNNPFNISEQPVFEPMVTPPVMNPPVLNPYIINPPVQEHIVFIQMADGRIIPVPENDVNYIINQGGGQAVQPVVQPTVQPAVVPKKKKIYYEKFYPAFE